MPTYLDEYQQSLETLLEKGGEPQVMVSTVREYNSIEDPGWRPSDLFTEWANGRFQCLQCRKMFSPEKPVNPSMAVVCGICSPKDVETDGTGQRPASNE